MPYVVTPIPPELRALALHLSPNMPPEALEAAAGQEHLLTDSGFVAHLAHMMGLLCLSPASAGQMIQMAQEVRDALSKATATIPASEFKALQRYADACALIAEVAAFQQGLFLAYLRRGLVEQPLADRLNVPVEHLDAAVNLLKLARKNSDGTPWKHGEEWR